jgi:hypothetical protein
MPTASELEHICNHADEVITWLEDKESFRQDLKYLRQQGIRNKDLATLFNVTEVTICYWRAGVCFPGYFPGSRNQRCIVIIREMARCLKEQNKAQREAGLKPQVSYS